MGARKWHVSRAEHHKEVANHLRDHSYFDWAASNSQDLWIGVSRDLLIAS